MSATDQVLAKDAQQAQVAGVGSDKLRGEAFERAKQDALLSTKNGNGPLPPELERPPYPWQRHGDGSSPLPWSDPRVPLPWEKDQVPAGTDNNKTSTPGTDSNKPNTPGTTKPGDTQNPQTPPEFPKPGDVLKNNPALETNATKIYRESLVIGGGVGQSFFYGIANLPEHLPQIGSGIVIGGTLAAMTKTGKLGAAAALVVGAYFTSRFILDTVNDHKRWSKFNEAVQDTWTSDANFYKNMHKVRDSLGNYAFDTSLSVASSYVGYKNPQLGEYILSILRVPPIVPNTPPPFTPAWSTLGLATNIMPPAGFYREYDDRTPWAGSSWKFDLHGSLRRVPNGLISRTPDVFNDRDKDRDGDDDDDRRRR